MPVGEYRSASIVQAGFECSTHKRRDGTRLDLLRSTQHDRWTKQDFLRLRAFDIRTVRTGARWHLIESSPGHYDFSSLQPFLEAAAECEMELLLDLLHFGWPDFIDIFSPQFVDSFADYTYAFTKFLRPWRTCCNTIAPVNEVSFFSWAGGDVAAIGPYAVDRGHELKRMLVGAAIASSNILLNELEGIRLLSPEPVIHIIGNPDIPGDEVEAENYRRAQYQVWDMLSGTLFPEVGGRPEYLDVIGCNFYPRNEWVHNATVSLERSDPRYKPFHLILQEVWDRYRRPLLVSETGTEDDERGDWFNYVADEVKKAHKLGIPVHGVCLYPILNHPGWVDDRYCCNGLFDYADENGHRVIHEPLAAAIRRQHSELLRSYENLNVLQ